ncbi:MAG: ATP-binding protein involved in chromosome partitioning [Alphaproteobacteria bacterium]|jgi:ATP-binding protein involved in chromosome partitioning
MTTSIDGVKHIIAVASGKGGVGKSTTAMNLAVALSVQGLKVGLMDADIYGPSQPRMMNVIDAKPESDGERIEPVVANGVKLMSIGFMMAEDQPIVWRGPMVQSSLMQMLFQVNWGELDVLVLDMPPGTGDTQLSISQKVALSGAIIVSTPQDIALIDARKGLNMFKKVNVPIIGFIENMSTFICPNCDHESHIFGNGGAVKAAEELGVDLLAQIPLDLDIRTQTDTGKPVLLTMPDSPQADIYRQLATKVSAYLGTYETATKGPVKIVFEESAAV